MRNITRLIDFQPKFFSCLKNYDRQKFSQDALAGVITGIVALPLAIAFGIASGVSPQEGIITAIVAGFIISLLGGSKVQIGGPTGAFIVIIYGIVTNPEYGLLGLTIATILAGVLLILMGVFKLGTVIKFIPYPIIIGFTAGIALTIFTTQMGDVFGLKQTVIDPATREVVVDPETGAAIMAPLKTPGDFIGKWICYFENFQSFNLWNFFIAILSILTIIFFPTFIKDVKGLNKIPGSLYAIIFMTLIVLAMKYFLGIEGIDTIGDRYQIESKLPTLAVPTISYEMVHGLMPIAFTIAILGAIESLLSAAVADGVIGDRHNSNTELIGQGVANILCPMFGGIPATGAIARTMTNINNGGRTPVAFDADTPEVPENVSTDTVMNYARANCVIIEQPKDSSVIGFSVEFSCDWEPEHGMEWTVRNGRALYVGDFMGISPWYADKVYETQCRSYVYEGFSL